MPRWLSAAAPLALVAAVLVAPVHAADEAAALLAQIKKVGREGTGNAEASKAWKALVAQGSPALLAILGEMKDDEQISSNWLRPAFDAIAEKAMDAGQTLPKADLEKFVANTKNAGTARRLAYEWLVKLDKTTPDRLLPGMIEDPSHELRRDAVARAIKEADEQKTAAAYRRALKGACDQDQVDVVVKALDKLGEKVDLAKHLGVVRTWHLVAPFEHSNGTGWNKAYPPEKGVDLKASYEGKSGKATWTEHTTKSPYGLVDLNAVLANHKGAVAYAYAVVESPDERPVEVRAGCINGLKVFLNGKEIFAREEYHHGMRFDQYAPRGTLKKGTNEILLKVCQNEQKEKWAQDWKYQIRLTDHVGAAVPFTRKATTKEEK